MTTSPIGFDKWDLEEPISRAIKERGWTEPTEIQIESVPYARKGRDIVGQARTGSGKAAAFGIPILERKGRGRIWGRNISTEPKKKKHKKSREHYRKNWDKDLWD